MANQTRRQFVAASTALCCSLALPDQARCWLGSGGKKDIRGKIAKGDAPSQLWKWHRKAQYQHQGSEKMVSCTLCPHRCRLAPGDRSVCRSRINHDGTLYSLAYGNACTVHVDPVEKKPLFHYRPQTPVFSLAATGCNFRCLNCQNWQISQAKPHEVTFKELFPDQVVAAARQLQCRDIAYTYSEATTYYEYMLNTAKEAKQQEIDSLWISNGYINQKPLLELCKWINGANVNIKSFSDELYRRLNGGRLQPVLNTFKTMHQQGVHFEMTNLVVPGYVDDEEMVKRMCHWILTELGPDYPLHFIRFFPQYKLDRLAPTPVSTLEKFRQIAMAAGIHYVYVGNVPGHPGAHTYCHSCGELLIERHGYTIGTFKLTGGHCSSCNVRIPGIWS